MTTCLTLGLTILSSTIEIQPVLYYQCTVGATVRIAKDSIYLQIYLVFLTPFFMHQISPPVESEAVSG